MHVNILENDTIIFKFLDGSKMEETFEFAKEEKNVMIGRMIDCKIRFYDNSLSRYQCMISYVQN